MNLPDRYRGILSSQESLLCVILVLITLAGLVTRFYISLNLRLDSDSVGMGILSMEIGKHGNYLLSGCHLYATDTFVFTELPLQLIPQILTNYHPVALKMVVFLIFIANIIVLAYLIRLVTGSLVPALLFSALASVIPPEGYYWLGYPTTHNSTILFGAAILLLVFMLMRAHENHKTAPRRTKKGKDPVQPQVVPWKYAAALALLVFLSVFSDTLILVWILVPVFIVHAALLRQEYRELDSVMVLMAGTAAAAYVLKTYLMTDWLRVDYTVNGIPEIASVTIPLFFRALSLFLNQGISELLARGPAAGPVAVILAILFAAVVVMSTGKGWKGRGETGREKRALVSILLVSVLLTSAAYVVSGYSFDINSARYLAFTAIAILMLVAMTCPVTERKCMVPVLLLLIISAAAGGMYAASMDARPNAKEYGLIANLSDQHQSFGFGTYWNSNIVTYLSGETVTVRSTYIAPDDLLPDRLNSCNRWYGNRPDRFFLVYDRTRPRDEAQKHYPELKGAVNSSGILQSGDFEVFLFHPA